MNIKENSLAVFKFLAISFGVSFLLLLILTFMVYQWKLSDGFVQGSIIFTYVVSCFTGAFLFCGRKQGKRYLWGGFIGLIYFVLIFLVSLVFNRQLSESIANLGSVFFLCVLGGMLGGMLRSSKG